MTELLLASIVGFLAGSLPFGLWLARLFGAADPRTSGSGNVGATNLARTGGLHLGVLTLLLDAAKGAIPAGWWLAHGGEPAGLAAGLAAVLGHCYSPWLRFRGGKGVATLLGVTGALLWPVGFVTFLAIWLGLALLLRWASLSSLAAAWAMPAVAWFWAGSPTLGAAFALAAVVVTLRHRSNLRRLVRGEEPRLGPKGQAVGGPP